MTVVSTEREDNNNLRFDMQSQPSVNHTGVIALISCVASDSLTLEMTQKGIMTLLTLNQACVCVL